MKSILLISMVLVLMVFAVIACDTGQAECRHRAEPCVAACAPNSRARCLSATRRLRA